MVVSWLKHDWESRRSHAHSILTHVKLGLVPAEMLTKLMDVQILGVDECKQLYDEALKAQASGRPKAELIHKMPGLFATRSTITAPIALHVAKKEDTEHSQFFYYNTQGHQWESLPGFHNLDFMASFITVDGSLYAAGGLQKVIHYWQNFDSDDDDDDEELAIKRIDRECTDEFQVYDAAKCAWDYLPSMITARCKFTMLYVDGCIYAIGGKDEREDSVIPVERYDIAKKEWEAVAPLPKGLQLACAVVYEGKILVQGELSDPDDKYQNFLRILVYDPSQNEWKTAWKRESDSIWIGSEDTAATPVMVPYQGKLYDVSYYPQDFDMEAYIDQPIPTIREWKIGEGVENIELSKESNDINNFTLNKAGAFQIKDEIFLNIRGFVCKSDIKLTPEQIEDYDEVDLRSWENLAALLEDGDCSMIVNFTFDKKRLCDQ
ncbi:kelch repeat and BTB domain-containing protein 3-like isoform X1 [Amphiura filiformis]|uniref:kelch repeat and BTB domain-containing protein 3-like isoform X1 n=1 Tax=Amphiura filiformis TaxID=82378 RepID=UPI003B2205F8